MQLSAQERLALQNLAGKKKGENVDYINIADARSLTEKGLAIRSQQGWTITAAGEAELNTAANE
ncbi:hypothetical protein [Caulobacter soli]|uniref:hypothetical protein n=1 Tax=Caulobacter soli TaxID=2708539 RepID=UPI0013EC6EDB|nr:hypothetical protein [Caulobacter soli]